MIGLQKKKRKRVEVREVASLNRLKQIPNRERDHCWLSNNVCSKNKFSGKEKDDEFNIFYNRPLFDLELKLKINVVAAVLDSYIYVVTLQKKLVYLNLVKNLQKSV